MTGFIGEWLRDALELFEAGKMKKQCIPKWKSKQYGTITLISGDHTEEGQLLTKSYYWPLQSISVFIYQCYVYITFHQLSALRFDCSLWIKTGLETSRKYDNIISYLTLLAPPYLHLSLPLPLYYHPSLPNALPLFAIITSSFIHFYQDSPIYGRASQYCDATVGPLQSPFPMRDGPHLWGLVPLQLLNSSVGSFTSHLQRWIKLTRPTA